MNSAQVGQCDQVTVLSLSSLDNYFIENPSTNRRRSGEIRQGEVERAVNTLAELMEETQSSRISHATSVR